MEFAKDRKTQHRIAVPGAADHYVLEAVELVQREGYLTLLLVDNGRKTRKIGWGSRSPGPGYRCPRGGGEKKRGADQSRRGRLSDEGPA